MGLVSLVKGTLNLPSTGLFDSATPMIGFDVAKAAEVERPRVDQRLRILDPTLMPSFQTPRWFWVR